MKPIYLLLLCVFLGFGTSLTAQSNYQIFMRLDNGNGILPGPVASLPGVGGTDFYPVGCTEHQFESTGVSAPIHSPYLITHPFYPATSPLIRQNMNAGNTFTVEIFFMQDNAGVLSPYFGVTLQNATMTKVTTAADGNALQETLAFSYGQIIWYDLINNTSSGWDLQLNQPI